MIKLNVGVIGLGYWGPSYVRNFIRHEMIDVIWGCDTSQNALQKTSKMYPHLKTTKDYHDLLKDKSIDLIAIATPPESHYRIAKEALSSNKHVLVAKPITTSSKKAEALVYLAERQGRLLHGDLTYVYTGAVRTIKAIIRKGSIGQPLYYDSARTNLGLIRNDVNVIWDLVPHDLSIIDYCFGFKPIKLFATASNHFDKSSTSEVAHVTIQYPGNFIAHIHVSWLSPIKLRTVFIGGTKKMILFNDVEPDEKLKIYDKSVSFPMGSVTPLKPVYRSGNILTPKIDNEEALFLEFNDVIKQITTKRITYKNAKRNISIIKILEACDKSIKNEKIVYL